MWVTSLLGHVDNECAPCLGWLQRIVGVSSIMGC